MDQSHSTTATRRKGQHLTYEERVTIQLRLKDGWKPARIARELGCAPNTVRNEIKRGTVELYNGHVQRYKVDAGQRTYEANRRNSCRIPATCEITITKIEGTIERRFSDDIGLNLYEFI